MNSKAISEGRDPLLPVSLAAMARAAEQVGRQALMTKTRLIVWREGQIRYLDSAIYEPGPSDPQSRPDALAGV
ncbi:hypothetical protein [Thiorhodovibrio frisius]|uniref:Uncharacterized protein n=1 Tax=Thiorhodovibrio frisius TaxID=631362 RepID=H8Z367_9GAMM|nr:hypothetical protein [Thiorhodovibrio frisius]EIC21775.1 hypothetical protein Thi970DRAFT_02005 [Thiorhodovibrio frisius]WPL21742.1 hypothetical protein Thiofri_01875 [Thiorhodovibrio frisius]